MVCITISSPKCHLKCAVLMDFVGRYTHPPSAFHSLHRLAEIAVFKMHMRLEIAVGNCLKKVVDLGVEVDTIVNYLS